MTNSTGPIGRPRDPNIPSETLHCNYHNRNCEHRRWKRGRNKDGSQRYRWVCAQYKNEANQAYYAEKIRG